ncbi:hypothetical protein HanIR_Chr06g0280081 [Helianthus annuus]|nr:hypothetical protein HanIR_Chr06g0280081 [Helianthus annuus]
MESCPFFVFGSLVIRSIVTFPISIPGFPMVVTCRMVSDVLPLLENRLDTSQRISQYPSSSRATNSFSLNPYIFSWLPNESRIKSCELFRVPRLLLH